MTNSSPSHLRKLDSLVDRVEGHVYKALVALYDLSEENLSRADMASVHSTISRLEQSQEVFNLELENEETKK